MVSIHPYRFCAVVVIPLPEVESQSSYLDNSPYSSPSAYYVAAAWDEIAINSSQVPATFTVGIENRTVATPPDERLPVTYQNVKLRSNSPYTIFVRYDIFNESGGGAINVSIAIYNIRMSMTKVCPH